jgi:hypothetical protein
METYFLLMLGSYFSLDKELSVSQMSDREEMK